MNDHHNHICLVNITTNDNTAACTEKDCVRPLDVCWMCDVCLLHKYRDTDENINFSRMKKGDHYA